MKPKSPRTLEPSSRVYLTWTPEMLRSAEVLADGGNLRVAADLCETTSSTLTPPSVVRHAGAWREARQVHLASRSDAPLSCWRLQPVVSKR